VGSAETIPPGFAPGSDVANLCLLGYDPRKYYTGRGPLEAASMGIELTADELAFRCNLITAEGDTLKDYSAGHISSQEARSLIEAIGAKLDSKKVWFYSGVSYRHLMVLSGANAVADCFPPHDITGQSIKKHLPRGEGADLLIDLMEASKEILADHPVNQSRRADGKNEANMIWLWGQGRKPRMPTFKERFQLEGSIISAVDLVKGIGRYAGLEVIDVPGATGYFDTNYRGKAEYALRSLEKKDFVFVHVEAPDEAGHTGDIQAKIKALEDFDRLVVGVILEGMKNFDPYRLLAAPDHLTPISVKTHVAEAVPFVYYSSADPTVHPRSFDEQTAKESSLYIDEGWRLMEMFLKDQLVQD
jgi:2,3-bisphosphoglycerate-independent phosphoglycerate mutase